jgi:hypothetical protein
MKLNNLHNDLRGLWIHCEQQYSVVLDALAEICVLSSFETSAVRPRLVSREKFSRRRRDNRPAGIMDHPEIPSWSSSTPTESQTSSHEKLWSRRRLVLGLSSDRLKSTVLTTTQPWRSATSKKQHSKRNFIENVYSDCCWSVSWSGQTLPNDSSVKACYKPRYRPTSDRRSPRHTEV